MSNEKAPTIEQYQQAVNELSVRLQVTESQRNEALNSNASLTAKVTMLENVLQNMQGVKANDKEPQFEEVEDIPKELGKKLGSKAKTLG